MADDLFHELLHAPDRDHCPGTNPVLSWREDDPPEYLDALEAVGIGFYELERRGVWHGRWGELEASKVLERPPGGARLQRELGSRWHAAKPVVRRRVMGRAWRAVRDSAAERAELFARLSSMDEGEAANAARQELARLVGSRFRVARESDELADPERDLARFPVTGKGAADADLWIKLARLSTTPEDTSLRVRFSFGDEGADDASHDDERHRLVQQLAESTLPEAAAIGEEKDLRAFIEQLCGRRVYFTQHIAYWNGPGGGALFHHDSFDEEPERRQLGVLYVQLFERTAWLALSIEDLALRVDEFLESVEADEMPWVSEKLAAFDLDFGAPGSRERHEGLLAELAEPGCGRLAPVVGCGPEFTSLLADAGHGVVLRPGDAILLPNHGLAATAMHSVFCGSPEGAYGLSMAIRASGKRR